MTARKDAKGAAKARLSHLDARGAARMVDVGGKAVTVRRAVAEGFLRLSAATRRALARGGSPKGDLFAVARIAAIQGAKEAAYRVPLAHPVPLDHVAAEVAPCREGFRVVVEVVATARTGVELEAIAGVQAGLLALYDMTKALERGATIGPVRLLRKEGGRSGTFVAPPRRP